MIGIIALIVLIILINFNYSNFNPQYPEYYNKACISSGQTGMLNDDGKIDPSSKTSFKKANFSKYGFYKCE